MSQRHAMVRRREQVHALMDALNARDFETLADLSFYHPEGEFHSALADVEGEVYAGGVEGLRKWAEDVDATWDDFHAEVVEIHELGDEQAVVVFRATGRAKASGIPLDVPVAQVWTWREGKLWRNVSYTDPSEAFEAVGVRHHAMSRENVEVVAAGIDALNARDLEAAAALTHEDAEWRPALTAGGDLERVVYRGPAGVAQYVDDLDALFTDTCFHTESLEPIGPDSVFFRGRVTARGRKSQVQLDVPIWAVWELRAGKVIRGTAFLNEDEALRAVDLRLQADSSAND